MYYCCQNPFFIAKFNVTKSPPLLTGEAIVAIIYYIKTKRFTTI